MLIANGNFFYLFLFSLGYIYFVTSRGTYIYNMQFGIGSMAAKIKYAYIKIRLTNKH